MRPYLLTAAARKDIVDIGRFTSEKWGKRQRDKYLKQLDEETKGVVVIYFKSLRPLLRHLRMGKAIYRRRIATVEPVFGHLRNIGLERFTLRGKPKVDAQWKLYCIVHNLLKIHRYGEVFG